MDNSKDSTQIQAAKKVVQDFYKDLDQSGCDEEAIADAFSQHVASGYHWRGMHPFYEIDSVSELTKRYRKIECQVF